jgi:LysR family transcriptional activator of nhaA
MGAEDEMDWLNYHHLRYFWAAATEGGVTPAARRLNTTQPTVSAQLRALEDALGRELFTRTRGRLQLTDAGRIAQRYADEIFRLGQELVDTLHDRPTGAALRLNVGVSDAVPKLIAYRLLAPALSMGEPVRLECAEDRTDRLLAELATHRLDVVLTDSPLAPGSTVRAHTHVLGESGVTIFGTGRLASDTARGFPRSLDGAPFLLPSVHCALRRTLDGWFRTHGVRPVVVGEFDDPSLLKAFGEAGAGLFAAPSAIRADVRRQYRVQRVGTLQGARERFYALTVDRQIKHPAVAAISSSARKGLRG